MTETKSANETIEELLKHEGFAVTKADIRKQIEEIRLGVIERTQHMGYDPGLWWGYLEPRERGFITALHWVLGEGPADMPGTYGFKK